MDVNKLITFYFLLTIGLSGCALPKRTIQPVHDPATLDDVRFTHYLATVPTVTVDEGMRAVLLLIGSTQEWPTFEDRWNTLERRGAVKPSWHVKRDQILDHGTLAFMLRNMCSLTPGINESLASITGLGDRRYALKTCVFEDLLPYSLPHDPVTGGEMVSALARAEKHIR